MQIKRNYNQPGWFAMDALSKALVACADAYEFDAADTILSAMEHVATTHDDDGVIDFDAPGLPR